MENKDLVKKNIEVVPFPGFYESYLYSSDADYDERKSLADYYSDEFPGLEFDADDFEFDFEEYSKDICDAYANAYSDILPDFVKSCKYTDMSSPKYYNFSTDRIFVDIEMESDWKDKMKQFITDNMDWFINRIEKDWTSRNGFMSFMDSDVTGWIENIDNEDERYIAEMFKYMFLKENNMGSDELVEALSNIALDDVYMGEYVSLNPEKQDEVNEKEKEMEFQKKCKEIEDKYQLKIQFPEDDEEAKE